MIQQAIIKAITTPRVGVAGPGNPLTSNSPGATILTIPTKGAISTVIPIRGVTIFPLSITTKEVWGRWEVEASSSTVTISVRSTADSSRLQNAKKGSTVKNHMSLPKEIFCEEL